MLSDRLVFLLGETHVSPHAVVGAPGEDKRLGVDPQNHGVEVHGGAVVREFATVHGGFGRPTVVGPRAYVMAHSHIGHDCVLGPDVTLATGATLGGHTHVHEGANIGLRAATHQHVTIGAFAMIGMGAAVTCDVPPFETWVGVPARRVGWNRVGMRRAGFSEEQIERIVEGEQTVHHDAFARDAGRRGR